MRPPTPSRRTSTRKRFRLALAALTLSGTAAAAVTVAATTETAASTAALTAVAAAENPYERGPDPTPQSITATRGSFATSQTSVSSLSVSGFGGGTIYYPTSTAEGTFGAVAIAPGFTADQSSMSWYGPRLASQGFVIFTIDTLGRLDQPASRGRQLQAALEYLTERSTVRSRIDATRLAVMGHSMGGGGSLEVASDMPSLKAAIPLTPWNATKNWSSVRVPTMIIGAQNDSVASVTSHAEPFYRSLTSARERAYIELRGASHFAPNTSNTTIAKYSLSWLKRFVDEDTRYDRFLCPIPSDSTVSEFQETCPLT